MSDPAEVITVTLGGKTFRTGRRTAAHIESTFAAFELAPPFPNALLTVVQGSYNTTNPSSAGTHDFDGVIDFDVFGADWWVVQRFLRERGWACWFRHTGTWAARDAWHIHAVSLGCPGPVGVFVPGQIDDYYRHALGLKGQHDSGLDDSWFPPDIDSTIFDYPAWEDDLMALTAEQTKAIAEKAVADAIPAITAAVVAAVLAAEVRKATATQTALTARAAWRQAAEK